MDKLKVMYQGIIKNIVFAVKICYLASHKYFLVKCGLLLCSTFIPLINFWIWKQILNNITTLQLTQTQELMFGYVVMYLSLKVGVHLLTFVDDYVNTRYEDEMEFYIEGIMINKISNIDLECFDSASMGDKVRNTRSNFYIINRITWVVFKIISEVISIIMTFIIVSTYNIWIGLFTLLLMIPYMRHNKKYTEKNLERQKEQVRDNRIKDYYRGVFFDNNVQFEIKLNSIGDYFIQGFEKMWKKLYKINKKADVEYHTKNIFFLSLNISSEVLVLAASIIDVMNQQIGIGDLQYNLNMVTKLREQASYLGEHVNEFVANSTKIIELQEFINLKVERERSGKLQPSDRPQIKFCNVSFSYPNSDKLILKNCSFTLEPYEKVGLIGLNGAGKSTLIKLIMRFYDPLEGEIKLDGINLKEYDIYAVRKVFGVLFQDYVTYSLPLREIIALSDFKERFNDQRLQEVCDKSGVSKFIGNWEKKYDTILGRYYEDCGKDFSGGQWQLVGLARAYFKESKYMILDEPSAALDPISEDRIFEDLYKLSRDKNSITISHRLSNTTLADKILVLEDGGIIEQGSHFELLKQGGKYANLFNLQASKYA